jgi:dTDP-glucose pyrophosphorylase
MGFIGEDELLRQAEVLRKSGYGNYLFKLFKDKRHKNK